MLSFFTKSIAFFLKSCRGWGTIGWMEKISKFFSDIKGSIKSNATFNKHLITILSTASKKVASFFRNIPTNLMSSIHNLKERFSTTSTHGGNAAPSGQTDEVENQPQSAEEIIKSDNGKQIMQQELTPPGSLFCSDGVVNTSLAIQTIAINELPDTYFENVSSFDQINDLPNIPAINQAIIDLDSLKLDILPKIDEKITQLKDNQIQNNEQIDDLNKLFHSTQSTIKTLKEKLTDVLNLLDNCNSEDDVNYINDQLKTYQTDLDELTSNLSKKHKITSSITMPNVRTGVIQAIEDSKRAHNEISYIDSRKQRFDIEIDCGEQNFKEQFVEKINNLAKQSNAKKGTLLKQFLLFTGQATVGSMSTAINLSGKTLPQDAQNVTNQHFEFSNQGMTVTSSYYFMPGIRNANTGQISYEGYRLEERSTLHIKTGEKVLMPTEYKVIKLTNDQSDTETLVTFDQNDFPKLKHTAKYPSNFPEYLKEPFKSLCDEINQQTSSTTQTQSNEPIVQEKLTP